MISGNILSIKTGCLFLFVLLVLSACATQPAMETVKIEPVKIVEPVLPLEVMDRKISALEDLLANNRVQEKDRAAAAFLISDYHKIKLLSQCEPSEDDYREIIRTLFSSLSQFDEKYLLSQGQNPDEIYTKAANDLYLKKQSILKKYNSRDYRSVITECSELEKTFGKDSMTAETGILLSMALAKEGRLSEATTLGEKIIGEMADRPDLIQVRAGLIEWLINTGKKEKALKEYQELIEDMNESQSVFDKATTRVSSQNKKIAESDERLDRLLDKDSNPDTASRITGILKELNNLKDHGDFTGARLLLLKWRLRAEEPAEIDEINRALASLDISEKQDQERLNANKKEGVDAAVKLIEEEDYESAITMLDNLGIGSGNNPEIKKQKGIAVEKLINQERNRAAKIFLAAKKTNDVKKKKELLLSAQDILNGLIEKYPSSEPINRVKSNLNSVNGELNKIGK